jgi:hypothetical protein
METHGAGMQCRTDLTQDMSVSEQSEHCTALPPTRSMRKSRWTLNAEEQVDKAGFRKETFPF